MRGCGPETLADLDPGPADPPLPRGLLVPGTPHPTASHFSLSLLGKERMVPGSALVTGVGLGGHSPNPKPRRTWSLDEGGGLRVLAALFHSQARVW